MTEPPSPSGSWNICPQQLGLDALKIGQTMSSVDDGGRWRHRRTRTGCLTCRARKIKCDESSVVCNNCSRGNLECVRSSNQSLPQLARSELAIGAQNSKQLTQAGLQRRRIKRSCATCKVVKKRCGGERPQCVRCLGKGLGCFYEDEPNQSKSQGVVVSPTDEFLTDKALVRGLCEAFFEEIAPLRCLGFLHRHTFLQEVENLSPEDDPLLLSVCALATKTIQKLELWEVGCRWARTAQKLVFDEIDDISVRRLMCIVFLYEHAARIGEQRGCFMLSGMASRYTQALSLNLEYDHDVLCTSRYISPVERECRRRLMWACYIQDTLVACGLRHLQVIDTSTIRIQLPCDERHFLYKQPCRTTTVPTCFKAVENRETTISGDNQGLSAFFIRLYLIRERAVQYIHSQADEEDPWRLTVLLADLEHWKNALPPELQFNSDVIAIRKEESMLSALVSLHIMYHQVNCLLYRCTIPSMLFPARTQTGLSMKASASFLAESRKGWFDHACVMSTIFEVALEHRPVSMADPAVAPSAYNAIVIKWLYLTNFVPPEERLLEMEKILPLVNIDLEFLQRLHEYHPSIGTTSLAAEQLVEEAKVHITQDPTVTLSETSNHNARMGFPSDCISPDHRMNPLSTYAQMRKQLPDIHAPDRDFVSMGHEGQSPGESEGLWVWR